ncbi:MAG TPA: hypothetical protein VL088_03230 [Pedobacter sp.]|nr:hypothetical protein [Pedobacter sp.]
MRNVALVWILVLLQSAICAAQQRVIFKEDFESYDNDWKLVNSKEFQVKQEDGKLLIIKTNKNSVHNGCLWYNKTIPDFFTDKNFSISFEAKSISSEADWNCFDFQWGKIQEYDGVRIKSIYQLDFAFTKVRLAKFELNKGWKYFSWSDAVFDNDLMRFSIKRDSFNKFEIIQQDGLVMVKVNDKLVYKQPISPQVGGEIGFQQCLQGEWQLDNLVIKQ